MSGKPLMPTVKTPNFWINNNGINTLKGVPGDLDNRPVLQDETILKAFRSSQIARDDLCVLLPSLLPEEQDRLTSLFNENKYLSQLIRSGQEIADSEQRRFNTIPVYTAGPRGGGGYLRHVQPRTFPTPKK